MTSRTPFHLQRRGGRPARWSTVLGVILVPLTIAGVLLWGLWNPQDRLDTVSAAVVNLDEPAEVVRAIFDHYEKRGFEPSAREREAHLNL